VLEPLPRGELYLELALDLLLRSLRRAVVVEVDIAFQRRRLPRNLGSLRCQADIQPHALECVFDARLARRELLEQALRVQPVGSFAIGGYVARRRRIREERARRGVELREPT